jgi:stearoyl-CoA desaturase (delta-9 desaturase)
MGLAKVKKTPPKLAYGEIRPVADEKTLEALIANRYEVMAKYAGHLRDECRSELERLKAEGAQNSAHWKDLHLAKRWLHRDQDKIPQGVQERVASVCAQSAVLSKLVTMREELRGLWTRTNVSADQLVLDLQAWCKKAEDSGIAVLQDFAIKLRAAHA